jgi:hypothetical protein
MIIDVRSKESVYITINGVTYYIDDSTDEQIVELYKGEAMIKYVPDTYAEGGEITPVVGEIKVKITDKMGTFEDHVGYKKGTVLEVVGIDEDGFMSTKEDYRLDHNEVEFINKDGYDNYIKSSNHLYNDSTYAEGGEKQLRIKN